MKLILKKTLIIILLPIFMATCTYNTLEPAINCENAPVLSLVLNQATTCGANEGLVKVSVAEGEGILQFQIDEGVVQTDSTFAGLSAGSHLIRVIDENSCTHELEVQVENQNGVNVQLITSNAGCGQNQGSIQVQATSGKLPYQFKLDGGSFQASGTFNNLSAGEYTILIRDDNACETSQKIRVPSGISLNNQIIPIIASNCARSGCHNGSRSPDLRNKASIINNASRIKSVTKDRSMPRGGITLSQEQIDQIACWVDDGALDN